jgi:uncharacterized protein (DUF1778 family)
MENRTHNIKVRLTADERAACEKAARDAGFASLSDFIRHKLGLN